MYGKYIRIKKKKNWVVHSIFKFLRCERYSPYKDKTIFTQRFIVCLKCKTTFVTRTWCYVCCGRNHNKSICKDCPQELCICKNYLSVFPYLYK